MSRADLQLFRSDEQRVRVTIAPSPGLGYEVVIGVGLLRELGKRARAVLPRAGRALMVHDDALPAGVVRAAKDSLDAAGLRGSLLPLTASEELKSLETAGRVIEAATTAKLERGEPVVALGGGVVGDVAGFAAASYRRGVPVVQCPTTLLSMVDASVGGKTGVNIRAGGALKKNMAGAFHQPALVVCDVAVLQSLPARELRSGMAECIKHAAIAADFGDPELMTFMKRAMEAALGMDAGALVELIARNVAVKAACIAGDERELVATDAPHGGRMALNAGHTVGHAIETLPGLSHSTPSVDGLTHGEAVGLGLLAESRCAVGLGLSAASDTDELLKLMSVAGLPTKVRGLPATERVIELMSDDKKVAGGRVRLSLPGAGHRCRLVEGAAREVMAAAVDSLKA